MVLMAVKTAVFVPGAGRCSWGQCYFCGYGKIRGYEPAPENVRNDVDSFFDSLEKSVKEVKMFGSGSFLDNRQFPPKARKYFIQKCKDNKIKKITVESRPEFITRDRLRDFEGFDFTVAIGLETADNELLKKIRKGFTTRDFVKACKKIHSAGGKARAYLLVGLPFVRDVKKSVDSSVRFALEHSDSVVLINLYPHYRANLVNDYLSLKWRPLDAKQFAEITGRWRDDKKVELDLENIRFEPRFPQEVVKDIKGASAEALTHPFFEVWQDYLARFYKKPDVKKSVLFLPCSYKKPYSRSPTHRVILKRLTALPNYAELHQVMISNPGVIPREFESKYPFAHYDWPEWEETEDIKKMYVNVTSRRIEKYLKVQKYKKVFGYLKPSSESIKALRKACKKLKIKLIECIPPDAEDVTSRKSLDHMVKVLRKK